MAERFEDMSLAIHKDEPVKQKILELPASGHLVYLIAPNEVRVTTQESITWGGDFASYTQFQQEQGHWPTPEEQVTLRDNVRRDAFATAIPLPEERSDSKASLS